MLKGEVWDWIIRINTVDTITNTIAKILHKCCKNLKQIFHQANDVPEIIKKEIENLSLDDCVSCNWVCWIFAAIRGAQNDCGL